MHHSIDAPEGIPTPFCDGCGRQISTDQNFCIFCGRQLEAFAPEQSFTPNQTVPYEELSTSAAHRSLLQQRRAGRPAGVSMLSVLIVIGGMLDVIFSVLIMFLPSIELTPLNVTLILRFAGIPILLLSSVLGGSGLVLLILAYGLWIGRRWAWYWTLVSSIVSLIASAIGMIAEIGFGLGLILCPIVLFYLTRVRVKLYFEK